MAEVFILLGGNVGDKSKIFNKTRKLLGKSLGLITKLSSIYATEPWGFDSELFWNQAIIISSTLDPEQILLQSQTIEKKMGRTNKSEQYEARTIDIDILIYNDVHLETPNLNIPHPRIGERRFVLVPVDEIAPEKRHPIRGMTVREMLLRCPDTLRVDRID